MRDTLQEKHKVKIPTIPREQLLKDLPKFKGP